MELDEMKIIWNSYEENLQKQEILNKQILKNSYLEKSDKAFKKIFRYEVVGGILCLAIIPILVLFTFFPQFELLIGTMFTFTLIILCAACVLWQLFKIKMLLKIDVNKSLKDNLVIIDKYQIYLKKEEVIQYVILYILMFIFLVKHILVYRELLYSTNILIYIISFIVVTLIGTSLLIYLIYKRVYRKNLGTMRTLMEELEELEKE